MMTENIETRTRRYRGIAYTRPIDEAKRRVPVIELADRLCGPGGLRRIGKEWVGSCALLTMRTARHRSRRTRRRTYGFVTVVCEVVT